MPLRRTYAKRRSGTRRLSRMATVLGKGYSTKYGNKARSLQGRVKRPFSYRPAPNIHQDRLLFRGTMPPQLWTEHRYCQSIEMFTANITGLVGSQYAFRLNSLFDPDITGVGHQPLGFDQMKLFYAKYVVNKVHIQIRIIFADDPNTVLIAAVTPSSNIVWALSNKFVYELQEQPRVTVIAAGTSGAEERPTWDADFSIADIEGIPRSKVFNENNYAALATTNPQLSPLLLLAAGSWNEGVGKSVRFNVSMTYSTCWSDKTELPLS